MKYSSHNVTNTMQCYRLFKIWSILTSTLQIQCNVIDCLRYEVFYQQRYKIQCNVIDCLRYGVF